jgi:polyphosphate glucokinase
MKKEAAKAGGSPASPSAPASRAQASGEDGGELPPPGPIVASAAAKSDAPLTLAIDVGGTHLKAGVLNTAAVFVAGPSRIDTPDPATPDAVIAGLIGIIGPLGAFDRVSMGFPGVVRHGRVYTAPNLGTPAWHGFPLAQELARRLGRPVRLLNDASVQGLGVITGTGLECVITLGTGFGFALFDEGRLAPHLEVGQHIARGKRTYDEYLGNAVLERIGRKKWNSHVEKAIAALETLVTFDTLYIGGGNAKHVDLKLPKSVQIVSNEAGITGGVRVWDKKLDEIGP